MDNDLTTKVEKLMRGFINLEKGLSNIGSRSEAMEKETYDLMAKMVQRINAHKNSVDTLAKMVDVLDQRSSMLTQSIEEVKRQLMDLTIRINDMALNAKEAVPAPVAEEKPKRAPRKKKTEEPSAPPIHAVPSDSVLPWDGVEFPVVRGGMEITPAVIARCQMLVVNNKERPNDIPVEVWDFLLAQPVENRMGILNKYGVGLPEENSEGVDQVLTAINTGD